MRIRTNRPAACPGLLAPCAKPQFSRRPPPFSALLLLPASNLELSTVRRSP